MKNTNTIKLILKRFALIMLLAFTADSLYPQINHGLYFSENIPQNAELNPSHKLQNTFFIGIPVLNFIEMEASNAFKYDDYVEQRNDSLYFTPDKLTETLDNSNLFSENSTINLLYAGFSKGKSSFRFGVSFRSAMYGFYSKNLVTLAVSGNSPFVGKTTDFGGNSTTQTLYQEYSINYAFQITPKLSIGITPKFLVGIYNAELKNAYMIINIDEDTYVHTGKADILINISTDIQSVSDVTQAISPSSWFNFSKNPGYAFDFGINYKVTPDISLSASLIDFGKIMWNDSPVNYKSDTDSLNIDGITLNNIYDDKFFTGDISGKLIRDYTDSFSFEESSDKYTTSTIPKLLIGGSYSFSGKHKIGGLFCEEFYHSKTIPSFSVNYLLSINKSIALGLNYNNYNLKINNLGFMIMLRADLLQFYFTTNSVFGLISPDHTNLYHAGFGINFLFDKDKNGVKNRPANVR